MKLHNPELEALLPEIASINPDVRIGITGGSELLEKVIRFSEKYVESMRQ